jgi:hypothetical protein
MEDPTYGEEMVRMRGVLSAFTRLPEVTMAGGQGWPRNSLDTARARDPFSSFLSPAADPCQ